MKPYKVTMAQTNDQRIQPRQYPPLLRPGAWKPEYEKYVRFSTHPRPAAIGRDSPWCVPSINRSPYLDPVVYDWAHIKVKTLVLGGALDGQDFPAQAKHIADTIPGAQLELIPNVGHVPHMEVPEVFNREVLKFLRQ
jgi:pimeloyl-ACP methyl ester carboxylesterase